MTPETSQLVEVLVSLLPWLAFVTAITLFALVGAWKERVAPRLRRRSLDERRRARAGIG